VQHTIGEISQAAGRLWSETQDVGGSDGPRGDAQHVANDAAHAGIRAAKRLDG
jgi:hypothetical protein